MDTPISEYQFASRVAEAFVANQRRALLVIGHRHRQPETPWHREAQPNPCRWTSGLLCVFGTGWHQRNEPLLATVG